MSWTISSSYLPRRAIVNTYPPIGNGQACTQYDALWDLQFVSMKYSEHRNVTEMICWEREKKNYRNYFNIVASSTNLRYCDKYLYKVILLVQAKYLDLDRPPYFRNFTILPKITEKLND